MLLIAAMRDDMVAFEDIRAAAGTLPAGGSRFVQFDCGHFDPYVAPLFERNVPAQIEFLNAVLAQGYCRAPSGDAPRDSPT